MAQNPASLRATYAPKPDSWAFVPVPADTSSSPGPSTSPWSRPPKSHVFELAPEPPEYGLGWMGDDYEQRDWRGAFANLLSAGILQFASTAIVQPFDVGRTLLQVQWIPRPDLEDYEDTGLEMEASPEDDNDASSDASSSSYFVDPNAKATTQRRPNPQARLVDEEGYVIHTDVTDDATRPLYIIPPGPSDGVWGMIRRVGAWKTEGYLSLWKGQMTATVLEYLIHSMQPTILSFLYSIQGVPGPVAPPYSITTLIAPVLSHTITGFIVSPLDLLRTRLIVQPAVTTTVSLPTSLLPISPMAHLLANEGGIYATYFHPHLLIPTLLDCTVRPLLQLSGPMVIYHYTGLDADNSPVLYSVANFAWTIATFLVTLPIETIRRRLQLQSRAGGYRTPACVETRPTPYAGALDCFWKILTEERSIPPPPKRKRRKSSNVSKDKLPVLTPPDKGYNWSLLRDTGISQLYRGMGISISANVLVFVLTAVVGERTAGADNGWAEL